MKKVIIGIIIVVIVIIAFFYTWYNKKIVELNSLKEFNSEFEGYLDREITGVDLTTIMNKAIENNNQYKIEKNSDGTYKENSKNSIEILVKPTKDGKFYPMEAYEKIGIKEFTKNFGVISFKSTKIEHHKNGRISKIYFDFIEKNK